MKRFLVTETFLDEANFGDTVWWSIPELAIPAGLQELPPNARVLTREQVYKFRDHILHGEADHRKWLSDEFETWLDELFGGTSE